MITSAVLCPHPPLLFRELAGLVDPIADLRGAARDAVAGLVETMPALVVVVGGAEVSGVHDPAGQPDVRSFGTTAPRTRPADPLPLSLGVGRRLLDEAGWTGPTRFESVTWGAAPGELDRLAGELDDLASPGDSVVVLLLGDGSARRGEKAPGFLDPRAFPFDDAVAEALADGGAAALRELDVALADELMVGGRAVFQLLGSLAGATDGPASADLTYRDDPFGVSYFVARWDFARSTS